MSFLGKIISLHLGFHIWGLHKSTTYQLKLLMVLTSSFQKKTMAYNFRY